MTGLSLCVDLESECTNAGERGRDVSPRAGHEASVPAAIPTRAGGFRYELEPVMATRRYTVSKLRFASPIDDAGRREQRGSRRVFCSGRLRPETARGDRSAHSGGGFSVVALHGGAAGRSRRGGAVRQAAILRRAPACGRRRSEPSGFCRPTSSGSMGAMRQAVCDVRRAAVWLAARPDVDPQRIGVSGISLGGIVSSLVAAVDPAIREGAFLLAGGDLSTILWEMPEGAAYRKLWIESGRTQSGPESADRPIRPIDLCGWSQGKAPDDDRRQSRRGRSACLDAATVGGRWPAGDPLVRLRPLLGRRLSFARNPPDGGVFRSTVTSASSASVARAIPSAPPTNCRSKRVIGDCCSSGAKQKTKSVTTEKTKSVTTDSLVPRARKGEFAMPTVGPFAVRCARGWVRVPTKNRKTLAAVLSLSLFLQHWPARLRLPCRCDSLLPLNCVALSANSSLARRLENCRSPSPQCSPGSTPIALTRHCETMIGPKTNRRRLDT